MFTQISCNKLLRRINPHAPCIKYHGDICNKNKPKDYYAAMTNWSPKEATDQIRKIANSSKLSISYKMHARERLIERGLIVSDILHVLKFGFVYEKPTPSTRNGYNKYAMENKTPNSENREIRVVVIPDKNCCDLKIVTVMWVDEKSTSAGSIIGEEL